MSSWRGDRLFSWLYASWSSRLRDNPIPVLAQNEEVHRVCRGALKALRPRLCAVVDGEDHDAGFLDSIRGDKGRIRNDQLKGAGK
jgi:hypothetical protein